MVKFWWVCYQNYFVCGIVYCFIDGINFVKGGYVCIEIDVVGVYK